MPAVPPPVARHAVETKQKAPGVTKARIALVISVLAALCVKLGLGKLGAELTAYEDPIAAVVLALSPLVAAHLAKRETTPTSAPRDDAGNELVPAGSTADTDAAAAAALAAAELLYPASGSEG